MIEARALPMGEDALLIEVDDIASVVALHGELHAQVDRGEAPWHTVQDLVPAARTVLLIAPDADLAALAKAAVNVAKTLDKPGSVSEAGDHLSGDRREDSPVVTIAVTYDGEDVDDIASITGLTRDEIVEAHTGTPWTVAFFGFAPGFAYLAGGDPRLRVSRRDKPRTSVPRGALGLAGEFSAIYPRSSPGGWQLLGHTEELMWDVEADPPSRLQPGDEVRFVVAGEE
ncbi:MAG: allophanate hydrolase subunit 1 [Ornithinimicrobium sp.]